ncbi:uncharacterized protein LOC104907595 isoform X2 [Beta vulgaris subsp. vulgaris]|uniref:uncharacterized protein LOC104907595 isoform X2 n=1 Tax=Beta vulgaris subsp. vulgaris TaxID=3555 RepID=UPI0020372B75|nr:uncharacterized protein LOC104907595 isoform X2 [Beta vulgaris subsp. vulgaris]
MVLLISLLQTLVFWMLFVNGSQEVWLQSGKRNLEHLIASLRALLILGRKGNPNREFSRFRHRWFEAKGPSLYMNELSSRKYVGIPGMNSICRALCDEPGIESKFGTGVAKMEWAVDQNSWSLISLDGKFLGDFSGLVATDKILASPGFTYVTGHPPPLDMNLAPQMASRLEEVPFRSYFVLMLAFHEPLRSIPVKGLSFINSAILSCAFCDSSKPGRASASECWVLHSTEEYAKKVIADAGRTKASDITLARVSEDLLQEFQRTGLCTSQPYFMKAHRWGSAFPTISIAREDKCLWDVNKRLIVCGDFCVSPNVEGAIRSGLAAASKFMEMCSCTPCL